MTTDPQSDSLQPWFRPLHDELDVAALQRGSLGDFFVTMKQQVKACFEIHFLRVRRGLQMPDNLACSRSVVRIPPALLYAFLPK